MQIRTPSTRAVSEYRCLNHVKYINKYVRWYRIRRNQIYKLFLYFYSICILVHYK